ncbi:protein kinase [Endozoicomonas sp. GU-1]|uniref:protein kinase domain-containing protein n=1 Tax=Endozoicomonas sp. GU-1 TaxID=3009078 RepID=UPI0022B5BC55|nr:protein kinase [Endozoicomonas sp. GU-1]WBA82774.1 protein kinase [Endozoicomonas sp. GU-1]WBA85703.1 protein kinase [Endozoicomonas sp. GU-1]
MPRKIEGGMRPPLQPHPPKNPKPRKDDFAGQSVAKVAGQFYVSPKKGETLTGKAPTPLVQRNALSFEIDNLQPAAPITFTGATIDPEYNYPIVPQKDLYKSRKLGTGEFGVVILMVHRYTSQNLALKIVADDDERRLECAQLIKIQRAVARTGGNSENIVNLIALSRGRSNKKYALLEYGGKDLRESLKEGVRFKGVELKEAFFQVVNGVSTLFQAGYQHHDIKPANILINDEGKVKICDFVLAEPLGGSVQVLSGTSWYKPPEKLYRLDDQKNDRADSWSLGCTFAEMRLGYSVMPVGDDMPFNEAVKAIKSLRRQTWEELLEKEGQEAADLFLSLTELDPADRLSPTEALSHPYFATLR